MPMLTKHSPNSRPSFLNAYGAALLWAAFILLVMSLPGKDLPDFDFWAIDIEDKLGHVAVFGLLAILLVWGLYRREERPTKKSLWIIFFITVFYGGATEVLQGVALPSRYASVLDFVADTIGSGLGIIFAILVFNKLRRK